ncbi:MAG: hypothetical protein FWF28_01390 [Micrococcales bacterium]|nr:hypothetical protein [Micrococcales bacterium]
MSTPKELLISVLRHEKADGVPWVPFAGVHAGQLVGLDATQVLTDADGLYRALMEVNKLYRPSGQPVLFDLQVEAEILGCELVWATDCPPSVKTHPLAETTAVPCVCTVPKPTDGRLPMVLDVMARMKASVGDRTALYGLICGPFTLASHLRGNDIFMDMYDDEDYVRQLLNYCTQCGEAVADMYLDAGMDVIAVVDPLVSQISAGHFRTFLHEPYTALFAHIRAKQAFSAFFVCGDATRNIEEMCRTVPDGIAVDENVDLPAAKRITDAYQVAICGNIPLTSVMLHGTQQDNMKYVIDLMDAVGDTRNLVLAPGCDMPYRTPIENVIAISQAVREPDSVRRMLENYVAVTDDIHVDLPDYPRLARPLIEVFTLDSATCAACAYMMGAANAAKDEYGESVDLVEYKYTVKENIARCQQMGVAHLPSIYVNGELKFSSIIPSKAELDAAIDEALGK